MPRSCSSRFDASSRSHAPQELPRPPSAHADVRASRACSPQAALAPGTGKASGTSVLSVSVGTEGAEKFVLCHLTPGTCDQWALDIGFAPEDGEVHFHLTGKTPVHLTGFCELEEEDDDDEDDDEAEGAGKAKGAAMGDDELDDIDDGEDDDEEGEEEEDDESEDEPPAKVVKGKAAAAPAKGTQVKVVAGKPTANGAKKPAPMDEEEEEDDDDDESEEEDGKRHGRKPRRLERCRATSAVGEHAGSTRREGAQSGRGGAVGGGARIEAGRMC
jgi:hypothetical protein